MPLSTAFALIPRVQFYAVLYGVLGVGFSAFAATYALDDNTTAAIIFGVIAAGEFLLAGWYTSYPDGIDDPEKPAPATTSERLLALFVVGVTAIGLGMLVTRLL